MRASRSSPVWGYLSLATVILLASGMAFALVRLTASAAARPRMERITLPDGGAPPAPAATPRALYAALNPALPAAYRSQWTRPARDARLPATVAPPGRYQPAMTLAPPTVPSLTPTAFPAAVSERPAPADGCAPSGLPAPGVLTQPFGRWHGGIDLAVHNAIPVRATHSGEVIYAGWRDDGYGNLVIVQSGRFTTYYGHLRRLEVTEGAWVARGGHVGWSGSTGNSSGPHVHYEIRLDDRPIDPLTFTGDGFNPC